MRTYPNSVEISRNTLENVSDAISPAFLMMATAFSPRLHENPGPSDAQATAFQRALCHGGLGTKFRTIYDRFSRESSASTGRRRVVLSAAVFV